MGQAVDYARLAAMARIVAAVAEATGPQFQIGVQMLWNALNAAGGGAGGGSFCAATPLWASP
ncbi:MAG: hypothetical protein R2911_08925 [Caldilineaceae bacterium]